MTEILTDRLVLRPPDPKDAADLFEVFSNREAMRYWSKPPFTDPSQCSAYIDAVLAADPETTLEFVVEYRGKVIGKAGFWRLPEVGYILHPDHWGQGIGSEMLCGLLDHGFASCGLTQVTADVDPDNQASIRLLTKVGFVETGREKNTLRIGEAWFDSVYFALEAETYKKARQT